MEAVQIRQGLKVHFIEGKDSKLPLCGQKTSRGFNLLAFKHGEGCDCLNCKKVMEAREKKMADITKIPTEDLAEQFKDDFAGLHEKTHAMECSYLDLWCLLSAVQLACRHPEFTGPTREIAEALARDIFNEMDLSPTLREVARRGWEPEYDEVINERTY